MGKKIIIIFSFLGILSISNGQVATTLNFSVTQTPCTVGLNPLNEIQPTVSLYPNPSGGDLTIKIDGKNEFNLDDITIYSVLGEIVMSTAVNETTLNYERRFELNPMSPGIYFVHVNFKNALLSKVFKIALYN